MNLNGRDYLFQKANGDAEWWYYTRLQIATFLTVICCCVVGYHRCFFFSCTARVSFVWLIASNNYTRQWCFESPSYSSVNLRVSRLRLVSFRCAHWFQPLRFPKQRFEYWYLMSTFVYCWLSPFVMLILSAVGQCTSCLSRCQEFGGWALRILDCWKFYANFFQDIQLKPALLLAAASEKNIGSTWTVVGCAQGKYVQAGK